MSHGILRTPQSNCTNPGFLLQSLWVLEVQQKGIGQRKVDIHFLFYFDLKGFFFPHDIQQYTSIMQRREVWAFLMIRKYLLPGYIAVALSLHDNVKQKKYFLYSNHIPPFLLLNEKILPYIIEYYSVSECYHS